MYVFSRPHYSLPVLFHFTHFSCYSLPEPHMSGFTLDTEVLTLGYQ